MSPELRASNDDRRLVGRREVCVTNGRLLLRLWIERIGALDDLRRLGDERLRLAPKGRLEHLLHVVHEDELDRLPDLLRDVAQVLLILARKDDDLGARQVRGQDLALQPTDREDPTAKGDLTR